MRKGVIALAVIGVCVTASTVGVIAMRDPHAGTRARVEVHQLGKATSSGQPTVAPRVAGEPAPNLSDGALNNSDGPGAPGPVASAHASLVARAKNGDLKAACTHAVELNECALRNQTLASAEQIQAAMASGGTSTDDKAVGTVAALLNSADRQAAQCAGVTKPMLDNAFEMQRLASQRSRDHARWLATNPALDQNGFLSDVERWATYKKIAKSYFDDAMRRRRLEDLPALLLVYFPGDITLPRPPYREQDEAKFLALYELATTQGMQVPKELAGAADALKRRESAPRIPPASGWGGSMAKSVEQGISKAMFPALTKEFCS